MQESTDVMQAGKYVIWHRTKKGSDGKPLEFVRWSPDATEMIKTGEYVERIEDVDKDKSTLRRERINRMLEAEGMGELDDDSDDHALVDELKRLRDQNENLTAQLREIAEDDAAAGKPTATSATNAKEAKGDPLNLTIGFGKHSERSYRELIAAEPTYVQRYIVEKRRIDGELLTAVKSALASDTSASKVAPKRERKLRNPSG